MPNIQCAGGVVLNVFGEVAVVEQPFSTWSLPKGHVEAGESLLEAAEREIFEETGLKNLTFVRELGSYERKKMDRFGNDEPGSKMRTMNFFLFRTAETALQPRDRHNPSARWVKPEEVPEILTSPKDQAFFRGVRALLVDN